MNKLIVMACLLCACSFSALANEDDFIINYIPSMIASIDCEPGEFSSCGTVIGCRKINGVWDEGICFAKSQSRLNTELMHGKWYLVTTFENGDFVNFLEFDKNFIEPLQGSVDFFIQGDAHDTDAFDDNPPDTAIISFDSANNDWFILDYWGRDVGTISSIEIVRETNNRFTGCEFYLNYPDLTYRDGICNPVRMTRGGFFKSSSKTRLSTRPAVLQKTTATKTPGSAFRSHSTQLAN